MSLNLNLTVMGVGGCGSRRKAIMLSSVPLIFQRIH